MTWTEVTKLESNKKGQTSCYCLHHWEEVIGPLNSIWKENDLLNAMIGKIIVILPPELEEMLEPLLGSKIAILRTDIPGKEYLLRVLPEREKTASMAAHNLCKNEQILNYAEAI
jgi:hypothetical protein